MAAKPIYGVGLDAGSRRTRLVVFLLEDEAVRFLGCGASESYGWIKGRIADQGAAAAIDACRIARSGSDGRSLA